MRLCGQLPVVGCCQYGYELSLSWKHGVFVCVRLSVLTALTMCVAMQSDMY